MGLVGWDAAGAHRLNLIFGIYSKYAEETSNLNPAAGTIVLNLSAVPVNEIWVVTHVAAANVTSNIPEFSLIAYIDANNYMLRQVKTPVGWYTWDGWVCLKSNDSKFLLCGLLCWLGMPISDVPLSLAIKDPSKWISGLLCTILPSQDRALMAPRRFGKYCAEEETSQTIPWPPDRCWLAGPQHQAEQHRGRSRSCNRGGQRYR